MLGVELEELEELEEELDEELEDPLLLLNVDDGLFWLEVPRLEPKVCPDELLEDPKREFEEPREFVVVLDKLEELEEPRPELLLEEPKPRLEPLELEDPNFDPVFELDDPKLEVLVPDPNLFWLELELGLLEEPNNPKDDDDDEDDPEPVEVCLFALLPDELDPKGDENEDDEDPWLLDP